MITIHLLPVLYGDTILIEIVTGGPFPVNTNLLVDCSFNYTSQILPLLKSLSCAGKTIDRFIITHYDNDHISSAATFIKSNGKASNPEIIFVKQVWLNAYRHLQFSKTKNRTPTEEQLRLVKTFISIHSLDDEKREQVIGANQALTLGRQLLANQYSWNEDFGQKAICIEHCRMIHINADVRLTLISPSKEKLVRLETQFEEALKKHKIELCETHLIDDAFELHAKQQEKEMLLGYTGKISASNDITPRTIELLTSKSKYERDTSDGNGSSIAFILEADNKKILMLADAPAETVINQLEMLFPDSKQYPLYFDAVKIAHHGSFGSNAPRLFELIDSCNFLISTNGGHPSHKHPDAETIAHIVNRPLSHGINKRKVIFNYWPKHIAGFFEEKLMNKFKYELQVSNNIQLP